MTQGTVYRIRKCRIRKNDPLFDYCDTLTRLTNNLSNAVRYRQRQAMTAAAKLPCERTINEQEVLDELKLISFEPDKDRFFLTYTMLDSLFRKTGNPDYCAAGLPAQTAQQTIKQCVRDMKGYFSAAKEYRKNPSAFTGCPELPGYHKKGGHCTAVITNQDAVLYRDADTCTVKLPLTKLRLNAGFIPEDMLLKEVKILPDNGTYVISLTLEIPDEQHAVSDKPQRIVSVDFGVENLMAVTNNCALACVLYKGGIMKSVNQLYNKTVSALVSAQTLSTGMKYVPDDRYLAATVKRNDSVSDIMHKNAKHFVRWCVENRIDTIVLGKNMFWKQDINIGHKNNQMFVGIPYLKLIRCIRYLAEAEGIRCTEQEESYTSASDFLSGDEIPVYNGRPLDEVSFKGRRVKRGLYRSGTGVCINADLNGSANILRKAYPDAFKAGVMPDFTDTVIIRHPDYESAAQLRKKQAELNSGISHSKAKRLRHKRAA